MPRKSSRFASASSERARSVSRYLSVSSLSSGSSAERRASPRARAAASSAAARSDGGLVLERALSRHRGSPAVESRARRSARSRASAKTRRPFPGRARQIRLLFHGRLAGASPAPAARPARRHRTENRRGAVPALLGGRGRLGGLPARLVGFRRALLVALGPVRLRVRRGSGQRRRRRGQFPPASRSPAAGAPRTAAWKRRACFEGVALHETI